MALAMVFPGQGSQSVGMLSSFVPAHSSVRAAFERASAALGFDLWQIVAEGPAEKLNSTQITQPAMLVADVATYGIWREQGGPAPDVVAGHSLGEFAALTCAGAFTFEDAVSLVHFRGQIMQSAVPEGSGSMAVLLGMEDAQVESVCADAAQGEVVEPVNFNSPGQTVIAGHASAVQRALAVARERGCKRAQLLPVSVPAHSSLMRVAAAQLAERLARIEVRSPQCRYISAVDAQEYRTPDDIRAILVRQLASPVRWPQTVRAVMQHANLLIESGPGRVLAGLIRRIDRGVQSLAIEDPESLDAALAAAAGGGAHV